MAGPHRAPGADHAAGGGQLIEDYVETGKVRYVFRDFPIESIHPAAVEAAAAARCAGEQGKYWQMHDRFFADQKALAEKDWPAQAEALGLDGAALQACVESGRHKAAIAKDQADGQTAGVRGTPSFFLGLTEPGAATVKATKMVRGARPYDAFKQALDGLLADKPG
jgi:protein-disulfide isomerase